MVAQRIAGLSILLFSFCLNAMQPAPEPQCGCLFPGCPFVGTGLPWLRHHVLIHRFARYQCKYCELIKTFDVIEFIDHLKDHIQRASSSLWTVPVSCARHDDGGLRQTTNSAVFPSPITTESFPYLQSPSPAFIDFSWPPEQIDQDEPSIPKSLSVIFYGDKKTAHFICPFCSMDLPGDATAYEKHYAQCVLRKFSPSKGYTSGLFTLYIASIPCPYCGAHFETITGFDNHLKSHRARIYCPFCPHYNGDTFKGLIGHCNYEHKSFR